MNKYELLDCNTIWCWLYVGVIEIVLVCPYLASQTALSVEAATEQLQAMQQELGLSGGVVEESPPAEGLQLIYSKSPYISVLVAKWFLYIFILPFCFISEATLTKIGQNVVREAREAGEFMPGNGQYEVKNLSEDQLRLLRTRSLQTEVLPPNSSQGAAVGGTVPHTALMETQPAEVETVEPQSSKPGKTPPEKKPVDKGPMEVASLKNVAPSSPAPSVAPTIPEPEVPGKTDPTKNKSKYDKYKDGSYWKNLGCF